MASIHSLAQGRSFDPAALNRLSDILEDIWIESGYAFAGQPQSSIDVAREVIAKCLLYHAGNEHSDASVLKALALQALTGAYPSLRT